MRQPGTQGSATAGSAAAPVPFTVIGGYLGAGKTTLLNRLLAADHGRRLAVVVNDFGEVALDELLIDSDDGEVVALANGCVCCTVADGFAETLSRIRELDPQPDQLVVEVSGVGDPAAVARWGHSPGFALDGVLVLADPDSVQARAADRYVGDTVLAQLRSADLVLVSRADVTAPERLAEVADWIGRRTSAPVMIGSDQPLEVLLGLGSAEAASMNAEHESHARHVALDFRPMAVERADLLAWLEAAPEAVVRVKGTVDSSEGRLIGQRVGARCEAVRARRASVAQHRPSMTAIATPAVDREELAAWAAILTSAP